MLFRKRNQNDNPWESVSDLMTGLMITFAFIAIALVSATKLTAQHYQDTKIEIYDDLASEFSEEELQSWGAEIDQDTLAVRFKEPTMLFDANSADVKPKFQQILNSFFPRYVAVLSSEKYKDKLLEIRIEGHTSNEWQGEDDQNRYLKNMNLSQQRAQNVLIYVFRMPELANKQEWLTRYVNASGLSFSHLMYNADGSVDMNASRRVEFRVLTDADKAIKDIIYGK